MADVCWIERAREANLVSSPSSGEIACLLLFRSDKLGEQAAFHGAFSGTWQIDMARIGTNKEIPAVLAVFRHILHGIIVGLKDLDSRGCVHADFILFMSRDQEEPSWNQGGRSLNIWANHIPRFRP